MKDEEENKKMKKTSGGQLFLENGEELKSTLFAEKAIVTTMTRLIFVVLCFIFIAKSSCTNSLRRKAC
jgi:hypothetical protein